MRQSPELAAEFERQRARLRLLAYRMLGSLSEAEDVVQDAWVRLSELAPDEVESLGSWLTTVVTRICLNRLRARRRRRERSLEAHVPDPLVSSGPGPEEEAVLADSVGLALLLVLEAMTPGERVAFVLHDTFGLPFATIGPLVGRSPAAVRQLASRGRRRVRASRLRVPEIDPDRQRVVVRAFFDAAREGRFEALLAVLDPEVVLRIDAGPGRPGSRVARGALEVLGAASTGLAPILTSPQVLLHPVLVNGGAGLVISVAGRAATVVGFGVSGGWIWEIDALADPDRVARLLPAELLAGLGLEAAGPPDGGWDRPGRAPGPGRRSGARGQLLSPPGNW